MLFVELSSWPRNRAWLVREWKLNKFYGRSRPQLIFFSFLYEFRSNYFCRFGCDYSEKGVKILEGFHSYGVL